MICISRPIPTDTIGMLSKKENAIVTSHTRKLRNPSEEQSERSIPNPDAGQKKAAVVASNDIRMLERYFGDYPAGRYTAQAREKLRRSVGDSKNIGQLKRYIDRYSNSNYRGVAKLKLVRLKEEEEEDRIWREAKETDSLES